MRISRPAIPCSQPVSPSKSLVLGTILVSVMFLSWSVPVRAQMALLGDVHMIWGTPHDGAVQQVNGGVYAYVVLDESDSPLVHYDVTDPTDPVYLGGLPSPGWPLNVVVHDDYVYVPGGVGKIAVLDASDPHDVTLVNMFDHPGTDDRIKGVAVATIDDIARYVYMDIDYGLEIWDFTDPTAPVPLGRYDHPANLGGWRVVVDQSHHYAYLAGVPPNVSLHIYDVGNPADPDRIYVYEPPYKVWDVVLSENDDIAYLATTNGLTVLDISNPHDPTVMAEFEPRSDDPFVGEVEYRGIALSTDESHVVLVGAGGFKPSMSYQLIGYDDPVPDGFEIVNYAADIPNGLMKVGRLDPGGGTQKGGLQLIDISDVHHPRDAGTYIVPHDATAFYSVDVCVGVVGDAAYVVDRYMGLRTFDISLPANPIELGTAHCSGEVDDVYVYGDYAYVVQNLGGGFGLVDVADRNNPQMVGYYHTGLELWEIIGYQDQLIYLPRGRDGHCWGFEVVDVSTPSDPQFFARHPMENWGLGEPLIEGHYLYSAGGYIYDIANPAHPVLAGNMHNDIRLAWGVGILKLGPYVYLAKSRWPSGEYALASFMIVDVTNIAELGPVVIGDCETPEMTDCGAVQSIVVDPERMFERVYLSMGSSGIGVVDVTDPTDPVYVTTISEDLGGNPLGNVCSISLAGHYLYTNDYRQGCFLSEYDISNGVENLQLISQVPNDFFGWTARVADGYVYRTRLNGLDIVDAPNAVQEDVTPPVAVGDFSATLRGACVDLSWTNPGDEDFVATKIMRKVNSYPTSVFDGSQVYDGRDTSYSDADIDSMTTYYYTAFAYDEVLNYSPAVPSAQDSVAVEDPYPPAPVTGFTAVGRDGEADLVWENPPDADWAGTKVVRKTGGYPNSITDGTEVYDGTEDRCPDTELSNDTLYYYTAFAYDEVLNYSPSVESAQDFAVPHPIRFDDTFADDTLGEPPGKWHIPAAGDTNGFRVYDDTRLPWWGTTYPLESKSMGAWADYTGTYDAWIDEPAGVNFGVSTIHMDIMDPDFGFQNTELEMIYFGYQNEDNYGVLQLKPHYMDCVRLYQYVGGVETIDFRMDWAMTAGTDEHWYHSRLDVQRSGLEFFISGTLLFDLEGDQMYYRNGDSYYTATLPTPYTYLPGRIGVEVRLGAYFDNALVAGNLRPDSFALVYPAEGDTVYVDPLTFDWEDAVDPDPGDSVWYGLYLSPDSTFEDTTGTMVADSLPESEYTWDPLAILTSQLQEADRSDPSKQDPQWNGYMRERMHAADTTFYWKVKAYDQYDAYQWSDQVWSFFLTTGAFVVGPDDGLLTLPTRFALFPNYPNPFNPITEIRYDLPVDCRVTVEIFNILGQRVATLVDEQQQAGHKKIRWHSRGIAGGEVSSGVYFCRLQAGDFVDTREMVLMK